MKRQQPVQMMITIKMHLCVLSESVYFSVQKVNFVVSIKNSSNGIFGLLACAICFILFCVFIFPFQSGCLCKTTSTHSSSFSPFFSLVLLNLKSVIFFWRSFICQRYFACQLRLKLTLRRRDCVSQISLSRLCLCVFACVRANACTVVYFTVLCGQRHLLYEQFQLHRILWWHTQTHSLCFFLSLCRLMRSRIAMRVRVHFQEAKPNVRVCACPCIVCFVWFQFDAEHVAWKTHHIEMNYALQLVIHSVRILVNVLYRIFIYRRKRVNLTKNKIK